MLQFAARRLLLALPLLLGITVISFLVLHLAPGAPVDSLTGEMSADATAKVQLAELYGLDKPIHVQYWSWLRRVVRLDFGRSFAPDGKLVLTKIALSDSYLIYFLRDFFVC